MFWSKSGDPAAGESFDEAHVWLGGSKASSSLSGQKLKNQGQILTDNLFLDFGRKTTSYIAFQTLMRSAPALFSDSACKRDKVSQLCNVKQEDIEFDDDNAIIYIEPPEVRETDEDSKGEN